MLNGFKGGVIGFAASQGNFKGGLFGGRALGSDDPSSSRYLGVTVEKTAIVTHRFRSKLTH